MMTKFDTNLEIAAMHGESIPNGLDVVDLCAYVSLKHLYAMYYAGTMQKEAASEEKRAILYAWSKNKSTLEFLERKALSLGERISDASEEYEKNPSIEAADKLFAAFYALPEDWRSKK